ncbi:MAG TPA: hypothetical protein DIW81_20545 [Planctomycetaceae bacterium]|nr:hypothetical protein [Rubinisphaera sp.]HCS53943.1 hypothetical protein [Planctomycetaceae bacterium]|tara:strand:+ start:707 stop:910 length:204 start_codon:yes stop_codon:yes gene_type:complete
MHISLPQSHPKFLKFFRETGFISSYCGLQITVALYMGFKPVFQANTRHTFVETARMAATIRWEFPAE